MPCRWARQRPGALRRPSVLQSKTLMPGRFTRPVQIS
ncbi:hypothetical protein BACCAP_03586 [Pseudoflavonifractor capillosus ATCC 29799]|uniref:Uncharacterized protein n=1 Tax=Pseudoflavonifractor capillosus ATCC 29799 TaxID=411467 RepID=A6NZD5_9FIRM|nr:hypothetical protein BACCAP_03586 [Pseudoflavonifractor capillosus ATCC 29799]